MANEDAGRNKPVSATEDDGRARAAGSRKPGVVGRMTEHARETVESIRLPRADWRTFAWGLLLLILVIFVVRNWAPLRINFFGWYVDAPRAVVFAIVFVLGMVTTWLIEIRNRHIRVSDEQEYTAEAVEEDVLATPIPPEQFEELVCEPVADDEPAPLIVEDETAGDALSDEFEFAEPDEASISDDVIPADEVRETDQDDTADNSDQESSDGDDSRKSFWRK